ncbi:MAG: helix-turn-helix domain-containing protein [Bacteriovoracaceae bacterium]|jgi:transcriptional regulator with XRE-family HTH domain|nr:helix-turn-helix domain-containing protein [Bacteriovoracaceae bacterium]
MSNLTKNLKELLYKNSMTMAQLSRVTGIPPQTLNNWMAGQEPRGLDKLKKVSDYFCITLDELCFKKNSKKLMD